MDTNLAVGVGIGVVIGWFLREKRNKKNVELDIKKSSTSVSDDGEYKMVIVVRKDLKMSNGKAAAECAHFAMVAAGKALMMASEYFFAWKSIGQPVVVVQTDSEQSL